MAGWLAAWQISWACGVPGLVSQKELGLPALFPKVGLCVWTRGCLAVLGLVVSLGRWFLVWAVSRLTAGLVAQLVRSAHLAGWLADWLLHFNAGRLLCSCLDQAWLRVWTVGYTIIKHLCLCRLPAIPATFWWVGGVTGWRVAGLMGALVRGLTAWLLGRLVNRLSAGLMSWWVGGLVSWLMGWWVGRLVGGWLGVLSCW